MRLQPFDQITSTSIGFSLESNIYILDFNDSFTYNLLSELKIIDSTLSIKVIPLTKIKNFLSEVATTIVRCGIILGPGPGRPEDYSFIYHELAKIQLNRNIFVLGVCLGHQLILNSQGFRVTKAKKAIHGQAQQYDLPKDLALEIGCPTKISVQRYNSLAVIENTKLQLNLKKTQFFSSNGEVIIYLGERILTYQFHPESIGTTCPKYFFMRLVNFLI